MPDAMESTAQLMQRLFEWWVTPADAPVTTQFLDENMIYDAGHGGLDGPGWRWWVAQKPAWDELRVICTVVGENRGGMVFEGVDSVTALRHRIVWIVEVLDGRVSKVTETSALVDQADERAARSLLARESVP